MDNDNKDSNNSGAGGFLQQGLNSIGMGGGQGQQQNQQQPQGGNQESSGGGGGGFLSGIGDKLNSAAGGGRESEKNEDYLDKGAFLCLRFQFPVLVVQLG